MTLDSRWPGTIEGGRSGDKLPQQFLEPLPGATNVARLGWIMRLQTKIDQADQNSAAAVEN